MSLANLNFANSLIPAVVRDATTGAVLTLAYMNEESLRKTLETGQTWFWSRSRNELWHKGATSGNTQQVVSITADCARDALLITVLPAGPACHTGAYSCFEGVPEPSLDLDRLMRILRDRHEKRPEALTPLISSTKAATRSSRKSARKPRRWSSPPRDRAANGSLRRSPT